MIRHSTYPTRIKDMPLNMAELFEGAAFVFKVLDSVKEDYNDYCKRNKYSKNLNDCFQIAINTANVFISRISFENKILDRKWWKDDLEFFWHRGYRKRKKFMQAFYLVLTEIQNKIDELTEEFLNEEVHSTRTGFTLNR